MTSTAPATPQWIPREMSPQAALPRPAPAPAPVRAARRPGRGPVGYGLRLALPPALTVAVFPGVLALLGGAGAWLRALVLLAGWAALWVLAAAPRPGEPDVHDRQLDLILGLPLLGAAAWLRLAFGDVARAGSALTGRDVVALVAFLAGATLLLLGTRLFLRVRWVLLLPLLALPSSPAPTPVTAALLAAAVLVLAVGLRGRRGARVPARLQRLPRLAPALSGVVVLGLLLAGAAVAAATP